MGILPDIVDFGDPGFDFFPDTIPIEQANVADSNATEPRDEQPYGVDIMFDFVTGDLVLTPSGDFRYTDERRGLEQWISATLLTPKGEDLIYSYEYGTTLSDIVGHEEDMHLTTSFRAEIERALMQHDRIDDLHAFEVVQHGDGHYHILFDVITDDSSVVTFEGINVAR